MHRSGNRASPASIGTPLCRAGEIAALYARGFDAAERSVVTAPVGTTIAELVTRAIPGLPVERRDSVRVVIGGHVVPVNRWRRVRLKEGQVAAISMQRHGNLGRALLQIVVTVAAIAAAAFFGPTVGSFFGSGAFALSFGQGLVGATVLTLGNLLINALIPVKQPKGEKDKFQISGFQNQMPQPDDPIPQVLGTMRFAPPYCGRPYTESIGDDMYVIAAFIIGVGEHEIEDLKLGETPITSYKNVQYEIKYGLPSDTPLALYPKTVIQENFSIVLRFDNGAEVRRSAVDADRISVEIAFPGGLYKLNSDGVAQIARVSVKIEAREVGEVSWTTITTLSFAEKKQKQFSRTHEWQTPSRAQYEIQITRTTADHLPSSRQVTTCQLAAIRTFRPEYPFVSHRPLAMVAMRIKATEQLNGVVDNFNAEVSPVISVLSAAGEWTTGTSSNPAAIYRHILQGPQNIYPLPDSMVDLNGPFDSIEEWHRHCVNAGLTYNAIHDQNQDIGEVLMDVAGAGRARPHDRGNKLGVVIDRPRDLVLAHVTARNALSFEGARAYAIKPDAFRVRFRDAANRYRDAERIIPRPGLIGDPQRVVAIDLPGKTGAEEIYREAIRRWYEADLRPDSFVVETQDCDHLTRGDLVHVAHDIVDRTIVAARVREVDADRVNLDTEVEQVAGVSYLCRFHSVADDASPDAPQLTSLCTVTTTPGTSTEIIIGSGTMPQVGDLAMFSTTTALTLDCVVKEIERTADGGQRLTLINHAPELDAYAADYDVPEWTATGDEVDGETTAPDLPIITATSGARADNDVIFNVSPGASNTTAVTGYEVRHRLDGAGVWITVAVDPSVAQLTVSGTYTSGQVVEYAARAQGPDGTWSDWTATAEHTVAATDAEDATATGYYAETIGDGVLSTFSITHGLNSTDVLVTVKKISTGEETETVSKVTTDADTVTIGFGATIPTTNEFRVLIQRVGEEA